MLESVPEEFGGPKLHRDGKLSNWCYNQEGDFFVCIDFGGFCSTSLEDWFGIVDARYIDSIFGIVIAGTSPVVRVLQSFDDWRLNTTRSLDMYLLALAVIELYIGHLPAAVDYYKYGPERMEEYLAVVCDYDWADCAELADASPQMMDFLLWCTEPDHENRPPTAAEALQHEWLADQLAAVEEAVAKATPAWAATNNRLREALAGWRASPAQTAAPADSSSASSNNNSDASRCSPADCTTDNSEQLLPSHTSSKGGSSSMACSTPLAASDPADDAAPSPVSSCSDASLLLDGDSSASIPDSCANAACQQQDPAAPADGSNHREASSPAGCTADSSEQLRSGHSSSGGGGSNMACTNPVAASDPVGDAAASPVSSALLLLDGNSSISSLECCSNAGWQQQDLAALADGSDASSISHEASSCSPAGCTSVSGSGQSCLLYGSGGSGSSTVCTKPLSANPSTEKARNQAASTVSSASEALLLSPSGNNASSPKYCSLATCQQQDPASAADSTNTSSNSSEASSCRSAGSSEQLRPGHCSSGGGSSSMACIHPMASSDSARHTVPNPVSSTSKASLLLDDDSSTSSPECCGNAESQSVR